LAWKIMNVLSVPRSVYGGYFVHVLAVYLQCTSPVHHPLPPVSRRTRSLLANRQSRTLSIRPYILYASSISRHFLKHPRLTSAGTALSWIFNYLTPIVQAIGHLVIDFVRDQVFPRMISATTAFIDPTSPRSQQRDVNVIIVPLIQPRFSQVVTHQSSEPIHFTLSDPSPVQTPVPEASPNSHRPTSVALYTVIVIPPPRP